MVKTSDIDESTDSCYTSSLSQKLIEQRRIWISNASKSKEDRRFSALKFAREHGNKSKTELYKMAPPEKRILKSPYISSFSTAKKERILVELEPELVGLVTDKVLKAECKVISMLDSLTRDLYEKELPMPACSTSPVVTRTPKANPSPKKNKKMKGKQISIQQKSVYSTATFESSTKSNPHWSPTKLKESIPSLDRLSAPKRTSTQSKTRANQISPSRV